MNCYYCATIQVTCDAVALCSRCGVAVCPTHTYKQYLPAVPTIMAGPGIPGRRELICQACFQKCNNTTSSVRHIESAPLANDSLDERFAVEIADALVRSQPVTSTLRNNWKQKVAYLFINLLKPKR